MLHSVRLQDYQYDLPESAIAKFPLAQRDQSKLLLYREGKIKDKHFYQLPELLPADSHLFFNDTKVIPARLYFRKEDNVQGEGAQIEIFLLQPEQPSAVMAEAMAARKTCTWQCMVGNQRRWKPGLILKNQIAVEGQTVTLTAQQCDDDRRLVTFHWDEPTISFATIVAAAGHVPLPPYLNRAATAEDQPRYQTVYSAQEGAVAAPTAGLHFTDEVLTHLKEQGTHLHYLTLHVGAGTFQPIKEEDVVQHNMHSEQMAITRANVEDILKAKGKIIAVGTTSMRTLESLYWYGVQLTKNPKAAFHIEKLVPYQYDSQPLPTLTQAMENVLAFMQRRGLDHLTGSTEIFIFPGYAFRVCQGLITNFHMPQSTLVLLIAAFIGPRWRTVYEHALAQDYRFLSYGDSSLLLP